jgi:hypothetical protein
VAMKEWERVLIERLQRTPLKRGDPDGVPVRRWRTRLRNRGFVVPKTGAFDLPLENATKAAQIAARVEADGRVGPPTWNAVGRLAPVPHGPPGPAPSEKPRIVDCRRGKNGFPRHPTKRWDRRDRAAIKHVCGHYTGNSIPFLSDARFHVTSDYLDEGGAPAIAYCLGVDKEGTLFVFNDWQDVVWHCNNGFNTSTLGIVFQGGKEGPNAAQRRVLRWLFKNLRSGKFEAKRGERWPAFPKATTVHRRVNSTTCPGDKGEDFYASLGHFVARPTR